MQRSIASFFGKNGSNAAAKPKVIAAVNASENNVDGHAPAEDAMQIVGDGGISLKRAMDAEENNGSPPAKRARVEDTSTKTVPPADATVVPELEAARNGATEVVTEKTAAVMGMQMPTVEQMVSDFCPQSENFHPVKSACWKAGESVPYVALSKTFEAIEATTKRLKIIDILSNLFRSVIALTPKDLICCIYLCTNKIAPDYSGIELGVGEALLIKAIAEATGRSAAAIKTDAESAGDLGTVAQASRMNQRTMFQPPKLTIAKAFGVLKEIASMQGNSSMARKVDKIRGMLAACRDSEAKFIIRSLQGKLRIGLAEQSVLAALARAVVLTPPSGAFPLLVLDARSSMDDSAFAAALDAATLIIKTTYCELPNYDVIVPVLLNDGLEGLPKKCTLTPGVPLKPMLAHPTRGIGEVLKRFDGLHFTCEYKYDGERAQVHLTENGGVMIYSRNSENNTTKYPDIVARIPKVKGQSVRSCILDCESVAWDRERKMIQPFQVLSTRKRKDADAGDIRVQVCLFAFDLLFLNGVVSG
eukprot:Opistho-2@54941